MSISMLDNISYKGRKPDNVRSQFNTIAEMVSFSEDYLPEIYITLNAETGKQYMYKRSNSVDSLLGKWRELGIDYLADNISYENSNYPSWTNVKKALDGIMAKIDYIKPEITSFTSTAQAVYEVGQKVSNIVFNWTTNKNITTQTLTDCPLADANVRTATYTNDINSNKTFTLTIGDGQNTASKNISISFRNKIYYGSASIPNSFDSAFILGLSNNQFATSKSGSFNITVGSNEYGFIAFPSSFGTLSSVKIGGFDTDVISCGTISFTNASGGTTNYNIYRTGRHSLGAITMVIN